MRGLGLAVTMGLGVAVGAVAILAMPKHNPARRMADRAAANVDDAIDQVADRLGW